MTKKVNQIDLKHIPTNPTLPENCPLCKLVNKENEYYDPMCLKHRVLDSLVYKSLNYSRYGSNFYKIAFAEHHNRIVLYLQRYEWEHAFSYWFDLLDIGQQLYAVLRYLIQKDRKYFYVSGGEGITTEKAEKMIQKYLAKIFYNKIINS